MSNNQFKYGSWSPGYPIRPSSDEGIPMGYQAPVIEKRTWIEYLKENSGRGWELVQIVAGPVERMAVFQKLWDKSYITWDYKEVTVSFNHPDDLMVVLRRETRDRWEFVGYVANNEGKWMATFKRER